MTFTWFRYFRKRGLTNGLGILLDLNILIVSYQTIFAFLPVVLMLVTINDASDMSVSYPNITGEEV